MERASNKEIDSSKLMKKKKLTVADGLSYVCKIEGSYPQLYDEFLDIMNMFRSRKLDVVGVVQRVSTLLRGYPELIGFNIFLPYGYAIEVHPNEQARQVPVANLDGAASSVPQSLRPFPGGSQVSAAIDSEDSSESDRFSVAESLIPFCGHFKRENEETETSSSHFTDCSSIDSAYKSSFSSPEHSEEESSENVDAAPVRPYICSPCREKLLTFSGLFKK